MKRLPALLLLLVLVPLPALAVSLDAVVKAVEEPFRGDAVRPIRDFSADFFQESRLAALDRLQRGKGKVTVRFDAGEFGRSPTTLFRWDYEAPTVQQIICDGKTLWVYVPDNRQVIESDIRDVGEASADNPVTFLSGLANLSRDFIITWATPNQDSRGNWVIELRPRRTTAMMRQLTLVIDRNALAGSGAPLFPILSSTVIDPADNATIIEFSNIRVNRGAPSGGFRFVQPAGVEVIHPPQSDPGRW